MANPQTENGHTDIANEILDVLCYFRMPAGAMRVCFAIIRKTWGWHKKSDHIPLTQLAAMTKTKKPNIIRTLKELIAHKIVITHDNGELRLNKNYDEWVEFEYPQHENYKKRLSPTITPVITHDNAQAGPTPEKKLSPTITGKKAVITHDNKSLSSTIPSKEKKTKDTSINTNVLILQKSKDSQEILDFMHDTLKKPGGGEPIPNYGKERKAINEMLERKWTPEQIKQRWRAEQDRRGGLVSMVLINQIIGGQDERRRFGTATLPGRNPRTIPKAGEYIDHTDPRLLEDT